MKQRLTMMMTAVMLCLLTAEATVKLPRLFQDGMVMQRGTDIPVWGWAEAGEQVTVSLVNAKLKTVSTVTTTADENGRWRADLPQKGIKAGGPYELTVKGSETISIKDVLVGDVWLCSGQSNIDVTIERVFPWYVNEVNSLDNQQVRLFRVQNETSASGPKDDISQTNINWKPLTKENAWFFSALGTFLGQRMQEETGVPQGVIVNSWGGTPIEAWVAADSLKDDYPLLVEKTRLYDNEEFIKTQQHANQVISQRWSMLLDQKDPGMERVNGELLFSSATYDDSRWATVSQWNNTWAYTSPSSHAPIIGSIWLRQHVNIGKEHAGKAAKLLLGTLFDADYTYVNGKEVGRTYYQYPPRRYDVPEGLLCEGDNVITVRFINKYGTAHFIPEKPYLLAFGDDRERLNPLPNDIIRLSETWKAQTGALMPNSPGMDISLQNMPTTLYNAVLSPLAPYALAGVVWYQGESNTGNARDYAPMLKKLMGGWRTLFENPRLPFVIVQLANFQQMVEQPQNSGWSQVREAQRTVALADPFAESVVNIDLGETEDIHPLRKKEVAERVGLCLDRLAYGKKVLLFPKVTTHEVREGLVVLTLDQPMSPGELKYFELAGTDGRFLNTTATASGNTITVTVPEGISGGKPVSLRYAWKDNPLNPDAYGTNGLPLSPFELKL